VCHFAAVHTNAYAQDCAALHPIIPPTLPTPTTQTFEEGVEVGLGALEDELQALPTALVHVDAMGGVAWKRSRTSYHEIKTLQ
jgi:hypothetical protein